MEHDIPYLWNQTKDKNLKTLLHTLKTTSQTPYPNLVTANQCHHKLDNKN
jgi:hypothetical protein